MTRLDEIKQEFQLNCKSASQDISGKEDAASQLMYLAVYGTGLIDEAYEAGRQSLADELVKGKTLGGRK